MGAEPITDVTMSVIACGAVNDLDDWCEFDGAVTVYWRGWHGTWRCPQCGTEHEIGGERD